MSSYVQSRRSSGSSHHGSPYIPSATPSRHTHAGPPLSYSASHRSSSASRSYPYAGTNGSYAPRPPSAHGARYVPPVGASGAIYASPSHHSHRSSHSGGSGGGGHHHHRRSTSHARSAANVPVYQYTAHDGGRHHPVRRSSSSGPYIDARSGRYPNVHVIPANPRRRSSSHSIERYNEHPTFGDKMRRLFGLGPPTEEREERHSRSRSRSYTTHRDAPSRGRSQSVKRNKGFETHRDPGRGGIYTV